MDGEKYYAFPSAKQLSHATLEELEQTGAGFRCKYIMNAAKMVNEGKINLEDVCSMDTVEARDFLMRFQGWGLKLRTAHFCTAGQNMMCFPPTSG